MKKILPALIFISALFMSVMAFAQTGPSGAVVVTPAVDPTIQPFLTQVFTDITTFGGMSWMLRISAIVLLVIASMKVTFLQTLIWNRLGNFQAILAPVLGLVGGLLAYFGGGVALTLPALFAYMVSGAGALALHELLDLVKSIPAIGPVWVSIISFIESNLGGGAPSNTPSS